MFGDGVRSGVDSGCVIGKLPYVGTSTVDANRSGRLLMLGSRAAGTGWMQLWVASHLIVANTWLSKGIECTHTGLDGHHLQQQQQQQTHKWCICPRIPYWHHYGPQVNTSQGILMSTGVEIWVAWRLYDR